ncbi:MAG: flagellin lysine-N-methylase [Clostridia bacterium]|nr:flagellin lysine-N-methylase [Clostridia bacterium]
MGKLYQKYVSEFSCLASACPDTCCAMWQICLDEQTALDYLNDKGEIGVIAREYMRGKPCSRRLALKNKKCPYLTKDNLCKVIIDKGEQALSTVCSMHPRFVHPLFEDSYEFLSLSCPRAVEMFLGEVKNGGVSYIRHDLQNPYLLQFYEYVCGISERFTQFDVAKETEKTLGADNLITELFTAVFDKMEYLEEQTADALKGLSYDDFVMGCNAFQREFGKEFFAEIFKYFSLMLYNEKSPVLPTAFIFAISVCALYSKFGSYEKAVYKFVKETEHSERNVKNTIRIMRSPKAKTILRGLFCFSDIYGD